jgi:hypothetical protein
MSTRPWLSSRPGRCSGCGRIAPCKVISEHVESCPEFAALFRRAPAQALDPEAEYLRWGAEDARALAKVKEESS